MATTIASSIFIYRVSRKRRYQAGAAFGRLGKKLRRFIDDFFSAMFRKKPAAKAPAKQSPNTEKTQLARQGSRRNQARIEAAARREEALKQQQLKEAVEKSAADVTVCSTDVSACVTPELTAVVPVTPREPFDEEVAENENDIRICFWQRI